MAEEQIVNAIYSLSKAISLGLLGVSLSIVLHMFFTRK